MDETCIDCEYGLKEKVACSSSSNQSGTYICADGGGTGLHVTCVVAVSASGLRCPPFFITQGKHPMSSWTGPIKGKAAEVLKNTELERFTRDDWFPTAGVKVMSEKGSMTMQLLQVFIRHFNNFVRKHVSEQTRVLLKLDGHSSRNGLDWLRGAIKQNIEVAEIPANTSQVLQPCQKSTRQKTSVWHTRERLISAGERNAKNMKFKFICALAALDNLSLNGIRVSFSRIGLWPMDLRFIENFRGKTDRLKEEAHSSGVTARVPDSETAEEYKDIFANDTLTPGAANTAGVTLTE